VTAWASRSVTGDVVVHLSDDVAAVLRRPVRGSGGFQTALRSIQSLAADNALRFEAHRIVEIKRLAKKYRGGGFQSRLIEIVAAIETLEESERFLLQEGSKQEERFCIKGMADIAIDSLPFSVRVQNCLQMSGFKVLGDLNGVPTCRLLQIRNFGSSCLVELQEMIHRLQSGVAPSLEIDSVADLELWPPYILELAKSSTAGISEFAKRCLVDLTGKEGFVLDHRLDRTLEAVGNALCVTRERARQIEKKAAKKMGVIVRMWRPALCSEVSQAIARASTVNSAELLDRLFGDQETDSTNRLLRLLLSHVDCGVTTPIGFDGRPISGWWVSEASDLTNRVRALGSQCPLSPEDFAFSIEQAGVPASFPLREVLAVEESPVVLNSKARAYVRRRAYQRDGLVHLLRTSGAPMGSAELGNTVGLRANAVHGQLSRDQRAKQLRPSGLWTLVEWGNASPRDGVYRSTLDAVVGILSEHGPQSKRSLINLVIGAYPVSAWAISNALDSDLLGVNETGKWDLAANGAKPRASIRRFAKPDSIDEVPGVSVIVRRRVDRELLRGSGLSFGLYLAQAVDLSFPGQRRTFKARDPILLDSELTIRRGYGVTTLTSLRNLAASINACEGRELEILFDLVGNTYTIQSLDEARHNSRRTSE
jgi:hypothetical protein